GNKGIRENWFERILPDTVHLPASLPAQGIGDAVTVDTPWTGSIVDRSWFTDPQYAPYRQPGHIKVPFWLTPDKYYAGAAWYQRDIQIPWEWRGHRVVLFLERPHWETRAWIDGKPAGTNNALATPHEHVLGELPPGRHRLTIRVDNSRIVDVGENSHSISDHTQGNWNGIVGRIELRATPLVWIADAQVYPDATARTARVRLLIKNDSETAPKANVSVAISPAQNASDLKLPPLRRGISLKHGENRIDLEVPLGENAKTWDEFSPALYQAGISIDGRDSGSSFHQQKSVIFGIRKLSTRGTQFVLNGRKTFFRGTLECCIFPKTGHPPTDVGSWKRIIRIAKAHGLNLIRFHSWCPPEAAFEAADELGFYYQVECSSWANQSTTLGDGKPVDKWIYEEAARILKYYGNHPSFMLMAYGNEPGGNNFSPYLAKWLDHFKARDPRRLYTSASGWPQLPENQYHVTPEPRIQLWGAGLASRINARPPETVTDYRDYISRRSVPVISHEIGQWCVYPNFGEIPKYTGYLKPKNFEIFRDSLNRHHLAGLAHQFLLASGKLQTLCYKEEIESALRTPGMGGFDLLDLHDFPGQGTALVGVLDPFWDDKGYVTAREYHRFCSATVPLARLARRVFTTSDTLFADLEASHFGSAPIEHARTRWSLVREDGKTVARGEVPQRRIPIDNGIALGRVRLPLAGMQAPAQYKLVVRIEGTAAPGAGHGRRMVRFENDWDLWIYPAHPKAEPAAGITVVNELNASAIAALRSGRKVLLLIPPRKVKNVSGAPVKLGFSSIFWNTAWTHRQAPTTLGILCDPKNHALEEFPTEYHSNWQWWYVVAHAAPMILDDLPPDLRPSVRVIDDWVTNHRLALLFEAAVDGGKLMVCSVDLANDLDPVRRQLRDSILHYMSSEQFHPRVSVSEASISALIAPPRMLNGAEVVSITADSAESGCEPGNAIDDDSATLWHTRWSGAPSTYPHELLIEFKTPVTLQGITVLPRQDGNHNGWIQQYECYVSTDGKNWGRPVAQGKFQADASRKTISFRSPANGKFLRFVALSGFGNDNYSSLAEVSILR
ncbi:MAG TPA: discoidin domain-containing protein, partial [Verrucomicrobiae bacterium]|nr:discoidin domain-containing protein [Verrucomicrobiae bacterium]